MWERFWEHRVRMWIRHQMYRHRLPRLFTIIHEEYSRVYYEDNFPTRQDFLHELVDTQTPECYKGRSYRR